MRRDLNTWVEISEAAYSRNLHFFRQQIGKKVELSVVIKSNAYGHGWSPIAQLALKHGAKSFCVHSIEEAAQLASAGFVLPILVMGYVPVSRLAEAVRDGISLVVYNVETLDELAAITAKLRKNVRLHLKLETGFHRQGFDEEGLAAIVRLLKEHRRLLLEGICTHLSNADDPGNSGYARYQCRRFSRMVSSLNAEGIDHVKKHVACSAAILHYPEMHFDMVRVGISQYGLWSSKETALAWSEKRLNGNEASLSPVLTWKTRVCQVKRVPRGSKIGYGCTYTTHRQSRIAVLPVGYADGFDRGLSNKGHVLIRGKRAPVVGRVCMNISMVDTTDIPDVSLEDEVVLLGRQGNQEITAEEIAGTLGTINYEVVTRINWQIPRILVD